MEVHTVKTPFYKKLAFNLLSIVLIGFILNWGRNIIVPIAFSILLAIIIMPLTNYFTQKGFNRVLAILIPLFLSIIVTAAIVYFLTSQVVNFLDDIPTLKERIVAISKMLQKWLTENAYVSVQRQNQYVTQALENMKMQFPSLASTTLLSVTEILAYVFLLPIYTFLVLYYETTIKSFFISIFRNGSAKRVKEVLYESNTVVQHYLVGLVIKTVIVFVLNAAGFIILGIHYALFLALLAALITLIPYIGTVIALVFCMLITLVSSENISDSLWVGAILLVVHFFDANFGIPLIVGNKVRVNAFVTIAAVLFGGALCGVMGMFLSIPGVAVLKVIFDKVPELRPWGILLGDQNTPATLRKPKLHLTKADS